MRRGFLQVQQTRRRPVGEDTSMSGTPAAFRDKAAPRVTIRSIVLGTFMCILIGFLGPFWTFYLHTSTLFLDFSTAGATFLLFLIVVFANGSIKLVAPRYAFSKAELLVISAMMMIASAITTMGLTGYLIPNITAPYYFASPSNRWAERLLPHIPKWMAPLGTVKEGEYTAIRQFYEGLPRKTDAIPWGTWLPPMFYWSIFIVALYLASTTLVLLLRKQWVDYERITFPIAQVPLELASCAERRAGEKTFLRDAVMWVGFAIPFLVLSYNALHGYFPQYVTKPIDLAADIKVWRNTSKLNIRLSFAMMGLVFMIPNRVAFSLWSLNLISFFTKSGLKHYGMDMQENLGLYGAGKSPIFAHMGSGAIIALVLMGMWHSRRHLRAVCRKAFLGDKTVDDSDEIISYRAAVITLLVCIVVMIAWMTKAGLPLGMSIIFVLVTLVILLGLTRAICQGGVAVSIAPIIPSVFMVSGFGAGALKASGLTALTMTWTWASDMRTTVMTSAAHGAFLTTGLRSRRVFVGFVLAILTTLATACALTIYLGYRYGAVNLHSWFFRGGPQYPYKWFLSVMDQQPKPNWGGWFWTVIGAAVLVGLVVAQRLVYWWPLHPVGWVLCSVDWTDMLWFSIFLSWLVKLLVLRLGGPRHFHRFRRFFLGMLLGHFIAAGTWACIDSVMGKMGNSVFWI